MAKKFMHLKRVVIPVLVLAAMLAQATPAFAMSATDLTDLSQNVQSIEVVTYDNPGTMVLASTASSGLISGNPSSYQNLAKFTDIDSNTLNWAGDALSWAVNGGVMTGKTDTVMDPAGTISYAEFITMIARLCINSSDIEKYATEYATNVAANPNAKIESWAEKFVYAAYKADLLVGIPNATNKGLLDSHITRADMAVLAANAMEYMGEKAPDTGLTSSAIPDWAGIKGTTQADSILTCYQAGIIVGVDKAGKFSASANTTRASAAVIAQRITDAAKRSPLDTTTPIAPILPEQEHITYQNGKGTGQRLPIEGDKIVINGTEYTLEIDPTTGILGYGLPGVDYYTGNIDDMGKICKLGAMAESNFHGQSGTLLAGPDGSTFTRNQWIEIKTNTKPTYEGKEHGEYSADKLWRWFGDTHEWGWAGVKGI